MAKKVFIGVGHGGSDPGAVSGKFKESALNLSIALATKKELERHGVSVGISRTKEEEDRLAEEIRECQAFGPDVAIEVHNNAGGGDGFEVYIQTGANALKSKKLATAIEKRVKATGQNSRGLKTKLNASKTDYFGWLRQLACPAVLLEGFFVDGLKDRLDYDTDAELEELGVAYAHGVLDFLGIAVKATSAGNSTTTTDDGLYYVQTFTGSKAGAERNAAEIRAAGFSAIVKRR